MATKWLYQVRIKVNQQVSNDLRNGIASSTTNKISAVAKKYGVTSVCTYDAFCGYCQEAEANGIEKYSLYEWTKATIDNPEKKDKHVKSFAFYKGSDQVYEKSLAELLHRDLTPLQNSGIIEELKLIDSNPENNPQPPKKY
ncbi:hypothetical protein N8156_03195 [Rhodospirillaceae bacterium]|nr:hypothetical protein [Rhodospirillaceae bacterium]